MSFDFDTLTAFVFHKRMVWGKLYFYFFNDFFVCSCVSGWLCIHIWLQAPSVAQQSIPSVRFKYKSTTCVGKKVKSSSTLWTPGLLPYFSYNMEWIVVILFKVTHSNAILLNAMFPFHIFLFQFMFLMQYFPKCHWTKLLFWIFRGITIIQMQQEKT